MVRNRLFFINFIIYQEHGLFTIIKFERGIPIAVVNKETAEVFAEGYTGTIFEENHITNDTNPNKWVEGVLRLSKMNI